MGNRLSRWIRITVSGGLIVITLLVALGATKRMKGVIHTTSARQAMIGFDLSQTSIPADEIVAGGPPRDGIPALTNPKFLAADQATFLADEDRVLGLAIGGQAKAYPIRILNWHEIVNDHVGKTPVAITYCPLCGTGMAFDPMVRGKRLSFGVSGLLYNSDVLMYDHQTESLWSQIKQVAVSGPMMGSRLKLLFLLHTTWGHWRKEYPHTLVLSNRTGYVRNYDRDPYADYAAIQGLMFPVDRRNSSLPAKEWVLGVVSEGQARAYPFSVLKQKPGLFQDRIGRETIHVRFDPDSNTAFVTDHEGKPVTSVVAYWFAWYAFYPHTTIYRHDLLREP